MALSVPFCNLVHILRRAALVVAALAVTQHAAFAQPAQFIRLHKLDNVVVPLIHPVADGGRPIAGVVQASDGLFYGTTICGGGTFDCAGAGAGTVFRLDAVATAQDASAFLALHAFTGGADGGSPYAPLIQAVNGLLYGTTICGGGSSNCFATSALSGHGTIFSLNPANGAFTTVHVFSGGTDGTSPYGALVQGRDGNLYGTTFCGGAGSDCLGLNPPYGGGTIFRLNLANGAVTTLHTFSDTDLAGCSSLAALVEDKTTTGVFYGTMSGCGASNGGTVFKVDVSRNPNTNVTILHSFTAAVDGANPSAPLLIGLDGSLYGTAEFGGVAGVGTIFKLNTNGTGFTTLHTFAAGTDGGNPYAALIQPHDGTLYGTTFYLSSQGSQTGTIFRLDPGSGQFETLYTFTGGFDGQNPTGTLAQIDESMAPGFTGSLVGTTLLGPTTRALSGAITGYGDGVIFRYVPPPLLLCPASVVTNATGPGGASVTLSTTLIDPANTATTITWKIDGNVARADFVPAAASGATSTRTTKSLTTGYLAGKAGTPASLHAVSIQSLDGLGLTSSCALTVEVDKLDQAITFAAVPVQTYRNPNGTVVLNATASSGLPVTFAVVSGPASLSGANTLTITGAGAIVVQASQAGNGQYNPAVDVPQTITVNKAAQTITFAAIANQMFGNPSITLAALASSGLSVSFTVVSGPATVSGKVLTITGAGTIVVTASQPGDGNYNAAAPVQQSFTVLDTSQSPLNRFVAFSSDSTWLHAGTVVTTGDVGANDRRSRGTSDDDDDHEGDRGREGHGRWHGDDSSEGVGNQVTVRLDNGVVMQQASSRVVGDTVTLGPGAKIYNLIDNRLLNRNGAILGTRVDTMPIPYLTMPAFPVVAVGSQAITVKKNGTMTLAAGTYGRVSVETGATLRMSGGLYQFVSLDLDHDANVVFQAAVQLRIQTYLDAGSAAKLILDPAAAGLRASQVVIYVRGTNDGCANDSNDSIDKGFGGPAVVNIGERAIVQANVYAPNGSIWLKSRSQGTGAFIGQHVFVGSFSRLTIDSAFF